MLMYGSCLCALTHTRTAQQPQDHEFKEGGNMHSPDKHGVLLKQGHGLRSGFKERCVKWNNQTIGYSNVSVLCLYNIVCNWH